MKFIALVLLATLVSAFAEHVSNVCPSRCHADRTVSVRECLHTGLHNICEITECDSGFSCSLPQNAFLISNNQLPLLEMVVEYVWSPEQRDLDTSTRFLDANVGFSCDNPTSYVEFGGDNTSNGGSEVTVVDFERAREDGLWQTTTTISANAGWYNDRDRNLGGAQLKVSLRRKTDGVVATGATLSTRIRPGTQSDCSATNVANVKVVRGATHTRILLERA